MGVLNKELIKRGMELEAARRLGPFNEKGQSLDWGRANKEYVEFIIRHGYIILEELMKHIKE